MLRVSSYCNLLSYFLKKSGIKIMHSCTEKNECDNFCVGGNAWVDRKWASLMRDAWDVACLHTWFLKLTRVHPNGISSAFFAQFTAEHPYTLQWSWETGRLTDRQTDHTTPSVTISCIYTVLWCGLIDTADRWISNLLDAGPARIRNNMEGPEWRTSLENFDRP